MKHQLLIRTNNIAMKPITCKEYDIFKETIGQMLYQANSHKAIAPRNRIIKHNKKLHAHKKSAG